MSESQKAKVLWAMKAAWDRCEEYYDPARKEGILGRTKTAWNCGKIISKCGPGESVGMHGKYHLVLAFGS